MIIIVLLLVVTRSAALGYSIDFGQIVATCFSSQGLSVIKLGSVPLAGFWWLRGVQ